MSLIRTRAALKRQLEKEKERKKRDSVRQRRCREKWTVGVYNATYYAAPTAFTPMPFQELKNVATQTGHLIVRKVDMASATEDIGVHTGTQVGPPFTRSNQEMRCHSCHYTALQSSMQLHQAAHHQKKAVMFICGICEHYSYSAEMLFLHYVYKIREVMDGNWMGSRKAE